MVLLSHGPGYSSLFNKLIFSKCLRYTGGFYSIEKEFNFEYKVKQNLPFNVCERIKDASVLADEDFYNTVVTNERNGNNRKGVYFFVRIVRSDKLPGIEPSKSTGKKGLNHGERFTSSTHNIDEYIKIDYASTHKSN